MFALVLLGYKANPKLQKRFLLLSCLIWGLVWGLRGINVGNDTYGYTKFFDGTGAANQLYGTVDSPEESLEFGFTSLAKFLSLFSSSSAFFFLVEALLCYFAIYLLYKNAIYGLWGLLLFHIMTSCSLVLTIAVRQCFSISLILISIYLFSRHKFNLQYKWELLKNKYFILTISCFLFSLSIHRTSILLLPIILFAYFWHLKRKTVYFIIASVFVIAVIMPSIIVDIFDLALSQVLLISNEKISLLGSRYAGDLEADASFLGTLSWCVPIFLTTYFSNDKTINTFAFKCLIIGFILVTILSGSTMQARLSILFLLIGSKLIIPQRTAKNNFLFIFFIAYTIFRLYKTYDKFVNWDFSEDSVLPYSFLWE